MAHYTIHHSDAAGAARPALDAICSGDRIACALAARLLGADGRAEVRHGDRRVAAVLTTAAALVEVKAKRTPTRRKVVPVPAPSWGRSDLFSLDKLPA